MHLINICGIFFNSLSLVALLKSVFLVYRRREKKYGTVGKMIPSRSPP